ncbi:MAG TPA: hypothetical protein VFT56_16025 [Sphingomonas sp.]|nr:hypothetical protein [Sphingomonas sp.]
MFIVKNLARVALAASIGAGLMAATGSAAWATEGTKASSDQQQYKVQKSSDGTVKYCTKLPEVTGSRLRPEVCKTAKQWKQYGVEINVP